MENSLYRYNNTSYDLLENSPYISDGWTASTMRFVIYKIKLACYFYKNASK